MSKTSNKSQRILCRPANEKTCVFDGNLLFNENSNIEFGFSAKNSIVKASEFSKIGCRLKDNEPTTVSLIEGSTAISQSSPNPYRP